MRPVNKGLRTFREHSDVSAEGDGESYGVHIDGEEGQVDVTVHGDVNSEGPDEAHGVEIVAGEDGKVEVTVDGCVTAEGESEASGVDITTTNSGADVDVTVGGDVIVSGDDTAVGVNIDNEAGHVNVDVDGNVKAEGDALSSGVNIVSENGQTDITVDGNISAEGDEAYGVDITGEGGQVNVTVDGDVMAEGESGAALRIEETGDAEVSVVVNGTISGTDAAVEVVNPDAENVELTVWAATENADGEIVQAIVNGENNEEAAQAIEEAINYIVRIAGNIRDRLTVTGSGSVTITEGEDDETYATAHEGEDVDVQIRLASNEKLKMIYYNNDEQSVAEVTEQGSSFLVRMLRGGAMLLGLDIEKQPDPEPDEEEESEPYRAPRKLVQNEISYVTVAAETEIHGVTAAASPVIQEVAENVSRTVETDNLKVDVKDKADVLDREELSEFDRLSINDRLLLMLVAMQMPDTDGAFRDTMSEQGKALAKELDAHAALMTEAEKAALKKSVDEDFQHSTVTIDGQTYESISLVLIVDRNGKKTYERYVFYHDGGEWILYRVDIGE